MDDIRENCWKAYRWNGNSFNIVDSCRTTKDANISWEWRLESWLAGFAFYGLYQWLDQQTSREQHALHTIHDTVHLHTHTNNNNNGPYQGCPTWRVYRAAFYTTSSNVCSRVLYYLLTYLLTYLLKKPEPIFSMKYPESYRFTRYYWFSIKPHT